MKRYAVYAVPGAHDADASEAVRLRAVAEAWFARAEVQDLTRDARRYGFHATLKAPMRLAPGRTETELCAAADAFATRRGALMITAPRIATIGSFRAVVPSEGQETELTTLASDALRAFDEFRAPLDDADRRRRRPERLTPRERELFERWGYPYVLDEFRFHMTLTDAVPAERSAQIDDALEAHFQPVSGVDVPLTAIAICIEPSPGAAFELLSVHPFALRSPRENA
ncbi:DUF1045 domain-containing protein [Microbacterium murale]|uniref:Phosphonate metabolism protein n=1 Tax=Microbacterium murale TaxID=1081040 RepID=A0ABU0PBQ1_9MICO|nr:DUF1045 domain-containing protein [Microbacterium murale]MDQ0644780.1 hypothetical protein [Microbacterium murale]